MAGSFGLTMTAGAPSTCVQVPTPGVSGTLPAIAVWSTGVQSSWSGPASAKGADGLYTRTLTVSVSTPLLGQGSHSSVHTKVFTPCESPVIWVFGSLGSAMMPVPAISVHVPSAGAGGCSP